MPVLLSIDLGISTGICVYDTDKKSRLRLATVGFENILQVINNINCDTRILEQMPRNQEEPIGSIYAELKRSRIPTVLIMPGLWKPFAKTQAWCLGQGHTKHESDSWQILNYYWLKTMGERLCQPK